MTIINSVIKGKQPVIDTLNVTPTTSAQTITAPQGTDGYSPVNVSAVTSSIDANIVAGNIKKDVQILGVTGSYEGTTPTGTKSITANGVYDVTDFASAVVNVPTTAPAYYIEKSKDANNKLVGGSTLINLSGIEDVGGYQLAYAYYGNTNITGALDLSSLTTISGDSACSSMFYNCTGITSVDLSSVELIWGSYSCQYMFYGCSNLSSADLSSLIEISNITASASFMFSGCTGLTSVNLSSLITITGTSSYIFQNCTGLTNIAFDSLVSVIGRSGLSNAFNGCTNLASISFPRLCRIGGQYTNQLTSAFQNCTSLTSLSFPNLAYTTFNFNNAFQNMLYGVTGCTVHFPTEWQTTMSSWSNITNGMGGTNTTVLFDLPNITTLDLSYLTIIDNTCFAGLTNSYPFTKITTVNLSNLEEISSYVGCRSMFSGCTSLTTVDLSKLTTVLGNNGMEYMFSGCTSLVNVNLSSLKKVVVSAFASTFQNCTSLTTLSFPALKNVYNSSVFQNMLYGVAGCTVHFPSNLSGSGITAQVLGGITTTVLYDLPATNILTGADTKEYERNPKYDTATALAWRINGTMPNTTTYYTSGLTDPTVGTTIYSDSACTIAETTVDSIS